jgi:hypothetical protein
MEDYGLVWTEITMASPLYVGMVTVPLPQSTPQNSLAVVSLQKSDNVNFRCSNNKFNINVLYIQVLKEMMNYFRKQITLRFFIV